MVKTRKFKLNKDMVEGEILDCVYTSSWNENNPNANYVSYEVDDYFYNRDMMLILLRDISMKEVGLR